VLAAGVLLFLVDLLLNFRPSGAGGLGNPWKAGTLEWATPSPPPPYNFARQPLVTGRDPLWEERGALPVVQGLGVDRRELILTSLVEGRPEVRFPSPAPTIWPFLAAIATTAMLIGSMFTPWAVVWGSPPIMITLIGWFWPKGHPEDLD
jgi:cytochrome c oxidase subunit 1